MVCYALKIIYVGIEYIKDLNSVLELCRAGLSTFAEALGK